MATGEIGRIFLVLSGRLISVGSAVAVLVLACGGANAQDRYPSKPVRMVVSFSAGGPTDTVARVMGARMAELLGQQFVVENRVGAGGNIGADMVAKSPPDGYTLLMATVSTHAINPGLYKKMPYDPVRDFAPIGQVGVTPTLLGVHPSVPATDVKSLVALVKENPGKYTYGSSGHGLDPSSLRRAVQGAGGRPQHRACAVSRLGADDGRPGRRPDLDGVRRDADRAAAGAVRRDPRDRRRHGGAHAGDARSADVAGAGPEGLRVLHLERDPRAGQHAAADRRAAQRGDQQGAGRSRGVQAPAGGRHRSDAGQHARSRPPTSSRRSSRNGRRSSRRRARR